MLFRIAFMVEEKRLGQTLASLHKLKVVNLETPAPVVIADDRPYHELIDLTGRKKVTTAEIKEALVNAGRPATVVSYAIKQMVNAGKLRPNGERGAYLVVGSSSRKAAKKRRA